MSDKGEWHGGDVVYPQAKFFVVLAVLVLLSACSTSSPTTPQPRPTTPNPTTPKPEPTEPPKPGELGVYLSPSTTTYANSTLTLQVSVVGGTPDSVQLLKNDLPFAPLSSTLKYDWNTSSEAEGSYTLKARAVQGDKSFDSSELTVVVDRTKPTVDISSRQPVPGATNISVRAPISVSFSEPLKASSLSDGAASLLNASQSVSKTLALSDDGLTLTITPTGQLVSPDTVEITFGNSLTDLAGNALASEGSSWRWELPKYFEYGTSLLDTGTAGLQIDSKGQPVVILITYGGENTKTSVKRWTPDGWHPLGPEVVLGRTIFLSSLVLDADDIPYLVWRENGRVYIKKWNGSSWEILGGALNINQSESVNSAKLVMGRNQKLYVVWGEAQSIYIKQWTGSSWINAADPLGLGNVNFNITPDLGITSDGRPVIGWCGQLLGENGLTSDYGVQVVEWRDDEWLSYFAGVVCEASFSMAITSTNDPIAVYKTDLTNGPFEVIRWRAGRLTGYPNPYSDFTSVYDYASLLVNSKDNPVVTIAGGTWPIVETWEESDWQTRDDFPNSDACCLINSAELALSKNDVPTLAYSEDDQTRSFLRIVGLNR